ncbi:hypothetical protein [Phnomibacter ginsenosidimutans]|uniref:hypothetical protein n=1 Tax=Phnomibacter ginsenosidimutans TaxID=2676868 RepID=UPI0018D23C91|nr:hypothetical protein [Phnomibacter ginsenosidimutans]
MRFIFVLLFCLQIFTGSSQDTALYSTSGILVYKYSKSKISKDFFSLRKRLSKKEKNHAHLANDIILKNNNFFINGTKHFNKSHHVEHTLNGDSLFIWHYSDCWNLLYLLENEMNIKFPIVSEMPYLSVPYISFQGIPDIAFRIFSVNCTFLEVNLFVDNETFCNRLNGTCDFVKFSVGKSYKLFILYKVDSYSSYLDNISYDKNIKVLKIPVL